MASDLIPAICPNCGGKLQVDPNADTLVCQFCGTEHLIRRNVNGTVNLEAFARCPLCKRNDQVEKVSAILNKQTSQSDGYMPQQKIYSDSDGHTYSRTVNVPVQTIHKTDLARRLEPPTKPSEPTKRPVWILLGLAIILAIVEFCCILAMVVQIWRGSNGYADTISSVSAIIIALVIGGLVLAFALIVPLGLFLLWKSSKKKDEVRVSREKIAYTQAYQQWQQAITRYANLYYCGRDDIVFIPGEKTSANVADMMSYIFTNPGK